ncbi:integrase core domain-containing protein [Saccharopolyspora shandongensis]|uniref:integrase core domain-containing protein n=1 Tax=Saccharopolyspora shandongensis TaxID=418495 RepID=UPI0034450C67
MTPSRPSRSPSPRPSASPPAEQLTDPITGKINRIKLVTDNGGAFKGSRLAASIASRPELLHIRTRRRSIGQNGVRERAFGSLKYEHLYRLEIGDSQALAVEAEYYRQVFNHVRPHEALGFARPVDIQQQDRQAPVTHRTED